MRNPILATTLAALLIVASGCAPAAQTGMTGTAASGPPASTVIDAWPETSREVAQTVMEKYGAPNETTPSRLIWFNTGPWKRTIVYRDTIPHRFPVPHPDLLEQFIDYQVPPEMFDELAHYDGSVIAERTKGEISARCDKEGANFLAINLAHDIVTGQRSVEEARAFYAQTMQSVMQGEMPPYTQGFQFQLPRGNTEDPDQPAPGM